MNSLAITLAIALAAAPAAPPAAGGSLKWIGCDICKASFMDDAVVVFEKKSGVKIELEEMGDTKGILDLAAGKGHMGGTCRHTRNVPEERGVKQVPVAWDALVVTTHPSNGVGSLTLDQVRGVFTGKIKNWKEVGGNDLEIKNVLLQPCTITIFSKSVAPFGKDIKRLTPEKPMNPVAGTNKLVEENEGAMGLQIYGYESADVKVLTVDGYLPDEKTFPAKYKFYQDYNVITKTNMNGDTKAFVDFALSPEGQEIVAALKHIRVNK